MDSDSDIIVDVFERLWIIIEDSGNRKRAVELILRLEEFEHELFMQLLKQKLLGDSSRRINEFRNIDSVDGGQDFLVKEIKKSLRIFTEFWKSTSKNHFDSLIRIFQKGEGVFIVLDYLENSSPEIRQLAREWVIESLDKFECVLDPIINILLSVETKKAGDLCYFTKIYDSAITLDAFKKLKRLIRNGGDMVINKSSSLKVLSSIQEEIKLNLCENTNNYLELMLEISLMYIRTYTTDENFKNENHTVQAAAAEFLDLVLSQGSTQLAYKAVYRVLFSLKKSIEESDGVLQLLLLNILRVIFFDCKIQDEVTACKELVSSKEFSEVYLGVLRNKDTYILSHWVNFIVESLPMVMHFLKPPTRLNYYSELISSFCDEIFIASEKTILFKGLKVVLHKSLDIGEDIKFTETLINNSPYKKNTEKNSSWFKNIFSSEENNEDPKDKERLEILKTLEKVIPTCLFCISDDKLCVEVNRLGVSPFSVPDKSKLSHVSLEILDPIMSKYPNEFVRFLIEIWKAYSKENEEENRKLIKIILSLNFKGKIFLQAVNAYVDRLKISSKKKNENNNIDVIFICHFISAVFSCITDESIPSLSEDHKGFWDEACKLLGKLEQSGSPLCILWLMEILNLFLLRISIDEDIREKKNVKKSVQDLAQKLISNITGMSFLQSHEELLPPFPPCLYKYENKTQIPLTIAALITLKSGLYKIVNTLWQGDGIKYGVSLIQAPATQVLKSLQNNTSMLDVELMSELMTSLICSSDVRVAEECKKSVIEFLAQSEFFDSMKNSQVCFKNWCRIVNSISSACYPDKLVLINEILSKDVSGVFISDQAKSTQRGKILKAISFIIYSGDKDAYQSATELISKTLIDYIKSNRSLDNFVLFTVRILLLKLSHTALSNIWPQLWPHILTELMQMMQPDENIHLKYVALKFLDLISAVNSEEFLMYQWLFFYDSMNNAVFNEAEEFPLVNRMAGNFIPNIEIENTIEIAKRKLIIKKMPATEEKLQKKIKKLCIEVVKMNSLRCAPDEASIANVIEEDFFTLEYKQLARPN